MSVCSVVGSSEFTCKVIQKPYQDFNWHLFRFNYLIEIEINYLFIINRFIPRFLNFLCHLNNF